MRRFGSFASRMAFRTRSRDGVLMPFSGDWGASVVPWFFRFSFSSCFRSNAPLVMMPLEENRVTLHFGLLLSHPGKTVVRNGCHVHRATAHGRADDEPRMTDRHVREEYRQINGVLHRHAVEYDRPTELADQIQIYTLRLGAVDPLVNQPLLQARVNTTDQS